MRSSSAWLGLAAQRGALGVECCREQSCRSPELRVVGADLQEAWRIARHVEPLEEWHRS